MTILPLTYFGSTGWFEHFLREECVIDLGENYPKQTERNHCQVLTAQGVTTLTVPVIAGGSKTKKRMREVRIDNSQRWAARHWTTLRSAYGRAPYWEHYAERFKPIYERRYDFLVDLNLELLDMVATILRAGERLQFSENYVSASPADLDLRSVAIMADITAPYIQVFADRHPFIPNLSIADAIFNEGAI